MHFVWCRDSDQPLWVCGLRLRVAVVTVYDCLIHISAAPTSVLSAAEAFERLFRTIYFLDSERETVSPCICVGSHTLMSDVVLNYGGKTVSGQR